MKQLLAIFCILVGLAFPAISGGEGGIAVLFVIVLSMPLIFILRKYDTQDNFLLRIFVAALLVRLVFGLFIYTFELQDFFGGDAITYDFFGNRLAEIWHGKVDLSDPLSQRAMAMSGPGWGMNYIVGAIYFLLGKSILVGQSFCAFIGAATAPAIYFCAERIFHNQRVARISAISIAFFPSFIIWSSQLMKDGLIIFLLVASILAVLQLQKKFSYVTLIALAISLLGIVSLRFYIFYMIIVAIMGSFLVGLSASARSIVRNLIAVVILGLALTYLGVLRNATDEFGKYGSLERLQLSRLDSSTTADSGFGKGVDVSTSDGAISAIPIGLTYLMLAPFPWEMRNLRQLITLPEVLLWWSLIPVMIYGIWFTIRNHLRGSLAIVIFTLMLTLSYSIFQGNVGTAYRQRTQIQVFLFIFIAVGLTLIIEKRENKKIAAQSRKRKRLP